MPQPSSRVSAVSNGLFTLLTRDRLGRYWKQQQSLRNRSVWHCQDVLLRYLYYIPCRHPWAKVVIRLDGILHVVLHVLSWILRSI